MNTKIKEVTNLELAFGNFKMFLWKLIREIVKAIWQIIKFMIKKIWKFLMIRFNFSDHPRLSNFLILVLLVINAVAWVAVPVYLNAARPQKVLIYERVGVGIPLVEEVMATDVLDTQDSKQGDQEAKVLTSPAIEKIVEVSAYTSRVSETDSSPCISASNKNICELDYCVIATNDYPLGAKIEIEGFGSCVVEDRMNSRYTGTGNIDIYMGMDLERALAFGRQRLNIKLL